MSNTLTAGQRAMLEAELRLRLSELDRRQALHQGGTTRAEHARDVLLQDGDDGPQRDADREVDLALNDREMVEVGAISEALQRVHDADYGLCDDCGQGIPFDRLKLAPQALRCVACESVREQAHGATRRVTM